MKIGLLALLVLLAACVGGPAPTARPPATSGSPSPPNVAPSTIPSASAPATSPALDLPGAAISSVDFSCRLPYLHLSGGPQEAGFVSFPGGGFSRDPGAPALAGYYDRAVAKWLPVPRSAVAPDGLHYATVSSGIGSTTPPVLHIFDAATGVEQSLQLGLPVGKPYGIADYTADGVIIGSAFEGVLGGFWQVDTTSGLSTSLGNGPLLQDDGTGHAFVSIVDRRDPQPATSALSGDPEPNTVVRRALGSGTDEAWFYLPGHGLSIAGRFSDGSLLVWAEPDIATHQNTAPQYWLVKGPGRSVFYGRMTVSGGTMSDGHGIWFGSSRGLFLFTTDGRLRYLSSVPGVPENGCA